ncbi:hypothetical protein FQR65_LT00502 [Abscondita terminalis]|nr:hypothetical protein FQR65_LT00502 [Abscondita terminalis]
MPSAREILERWLRKRRMQVPEIRTLKIIVLFACVAAAYGGIARFVESSPTLRLETIPSITKVEELTPSVSSHFRTEVINPHVAYKTELVASPSIAKVEHVIPSAQSLFKGELVSAAIPSVRYETALPAAISRVEHLSPAISTHIASPTISRIEHLSPAISSHKTEVISSPAVHIEHVASPSFARVEHVKTDLVSPFSTTFLKHGLVLN